MKVFILIAVVIVTLSLSIAGDSRETGEHYMATVGVDGVQRVKIYGGEYFFKPDYIIIKKGVPVEITVQKKAGIVPHNIVIDYPDEGIEVRENLSTNEKVIRLIAKKSGKYRFYCDKKLLFFKGHRERGMEGMFEVIE